MEFTGPDTAEHRAYWTASRRAILPIRDRNATACNARRLAGLHCTYLAFIPVIFCQLQLTRR
jgi:hypothetical protein